MYNILLNRHTNCMVLQETHNLLCENESLMGLAAALGDIKLDVLFVIIERFTTPA